MGMYLNQLPPTEVARLKAELAETLIANFCYPRFFDYRVNALRMRPVDRAKRQEVWQYLNAVDFNVWGRVDVDSPEFQRQVERLFIHFVQRNRSFFGEQGRKRMADVRSLISSCSLLLAEGLRAHLQGKQGSRPFGSPHPVISWSTTSITGKAEPAWEQMLPGTMQLQQQLQEVRGEVRPASSPLPSPAPAQTPASAVRPVSGTVPARRPRSGRPATPGATTNGMVPHEEEALAWPAATSRSTKPGEEPMQTSFPKVPKETAAARSDFPPFPTSAEAAPTMPIPIGKPEGLSVSFQPTASPEVPPLPARSRRGRAAEPAPATPFVPASPTGPARGTASQPLPAPPPASSPQALQPVAPSSPAEVTMKQAENGTVLMSDEDVVIFEQMRHQLVIWLRVEAVRSGISLSGQGAFQLVDALRHQDGIDTARLQVVSTLLNMCDQIIASGRATLFDYKQAMMFYLMHTRRTR